MHAWKFLFVGITLIGAMVCLPSAWADDAGSSQLSGSRFPNSRVPDLKTPAGQVFDDTGVPPTVEPEVKHHNGPKTQTDKIVEKFMTLDTDKSAGVSMDEYIAMVQQRVEARFAAMDADRDGEVTEDEYRAFWKSRMAKWYRLKR